LTLQDFESQTWRALIFGNALEEIVRLLVNLVEDKWYDIVCSLLKRNLSRLMNLSGEKLILKGMV
jgi:hypothetical protein